MAFRHLFGRTIGLRLREREETVMVLGEGAVAAGAACHKIPRSLPGVGYVQGDGSRPVRVRAGHVIDEAIRIAAARFPPRAPASSPFRPRPTTTRLRLCLGLLGRRVARPARPRAGRRHERPVRSRRAHRHRRDGP